MVLEIMLGSQTAAICRSLDPLSQIPVVMGELTAPIQRAADKWFVRELNAMALRHEAARFANG